MRAVKRLKKRFNVFSYHSEYRKARPSRHEEAVEPSCDEIAYQENIEQPTTSSAQEIEPLNMTNDAIEVSTFLSSMDALNEYFAISLL